MPSMLLVGWNQTELEDRVEAFESAWKHGDSVAIADFLPEVGSPAYAPVLCELVRIDLEMHWSAGRPRRLKQYLAEHPALQLDAETLGQVAFEEFRQRRLAGDRVAPAEYSRMGVDVSKWPAHLSVTNHVSAKEVVAPKTKAFVDSDVEKTKRRVRPPVRFPEPGDDWAGFSIVEELGRGAFGRVYLAKQSELADRLVALKIAPDLTGEPQKLAQLQHTNIMPVFSTHRVGDLFAACMPYMGSINLAQVIRGLRDGKGSFPQSGRMLLSTLIGKGRGHGSTQHDSRVHPAPHSHSDASFRPCDSGKLVVEARSMADLEKLAAMSHVDAVLWLMTRVADGLKHAHERGILHRDIKPANILLTDEGQPMLLDFNLATQINPAAGSAHIRMGGTFPYMAPEQLDAFQRRVRTADVRSDLYSLGVIFFEMLTGHDPFPPRHGRIVEILGLMIQDRARGKVDPRQHNREVPASVASIVQKLLAVDPAERYQSAADLHEDLERQLGDLPLKYATNISTRERLVKFRRRNPRLVSALCAAAAVGFLVLLPISLVAVRQNEIADRARVIRRAESLQALRQTRDEVRHLEIHVRLRDTQAALAKRGRDQLNEMANRLEWDADGKWLERNAFASLTEIERGELARDAAMASLAMAQSLMRESHDRRDVARKVEAQKWVAIAEGAFRRTDVASPTALSDARRLIEGLPASADALASVDPKKLDDADLYSKASDLYTSGRYRSALILLKELTDRNSNHFMAWYFRGSCHNVLLEASDAIRAFTVCIALQPDFIPTYHQRGIARFQAEDYPGAVSDLKRVIASNTDVVQAKLDLARVYKAAGDLKTYEGELNELLELQDCPTRAWFLRYELHRANGRKEEAARDLAEGLNRQPTDGLSWSVRGYYRMGSDVQGAISDIEEALVINPRDPVALHNKAYLLGEKSKKLDEAVAVISQLIEYYPDNAGARTARATYMARLGKNDEALRDIDTCLAIEQSPDRLYEVGAVLAVLSARDGSLKDKAIDYLARSLRGGMTRPDKFANDDDLRPLRGDGRFEKLAQLAAGMAELKRASW